MTFRELRADELEARIGMVKENGLSLLLYKNARVDMAVLDETVGAFNWQRDHKEVKGNMYAGIGIYDEKKDAWVWKWDCGTESNTEAEKGEASDSFKRAGFNWGIGRELYTAPFIWFKAGDANIKDKKCYDHFKINDIAYADGKITYLKITDTDTKKSFVYGKGTEDVAEQAISTVKLSALRNRLNNADKDILTKSNISLSTIKAKYKISGLEALTEAQLSDLHECLNRIGV